MASRREVLAAATATVSLAMIETALGTLRAARAQATATAPATAPAPVPTPSAPSRADGAFSPQLRGPAPKLPDEKPGWFSTKIKAVDIKDNEFTDVPGHLIALTRTGKDISALTTKCTHAGCKIVPRAGAKLLTCGCHQAQYNLDGTVARPPATKALDHFGLRLNADGVVEIDPGITAVPTDKEFKITMD